MAESTSDRVAMYLGFSVLVAMVAFAIGGSMCPDDAEECDAVLAGGFGLGIVAFVASLGVCWIIDAILASRRRRSPGPKA